MQICVIGTGYVGLCSGVGLAAKGNQVACVGRNKDKIAGIQQGIPPIFEGGLQELLQEVLRNGLFRATDDFAGAVKEAEATFLCVGTPSGKDGRIDLTEMRQAAAQVGEALPDGYCVVVVKSTVVPGTTEEMIRILEERSGRKAGKDFGVCMNPEFLREGRALQDFLQPDRVVVGQLDPRSGDVLQRLYAPFQAPILRTDLKTAEMIKYASNSLLATKISFANEVGNLCKQLGIDTYAVMGGVGLDHRIGPHFLRAGVGFGGSCFQKDVSALKSLAEDQGVPAPLITDVLEVNRRQRFKIIDLLERRLPVNGKTIAILGLSFMGGTDDIRESPALDIIPALLQKGAAVRAYDPQATRHVRPLFPQVTYCASAREALAGADACLLLTEWEEFRSLTDQDFSGMRSPVILEGRRMLDRSKVSRFEGICW
ncbi:MAG: UDP-glucose/GDP-mannose dehydrogenase family protein [Candidatus Aenigmarchaeota archaeon]|nr:UDP-glucose/GDP-mannose dehydrogenase family protein [Candidatus Aenigmarchaeota archaeon]